MSSYPVKKNHIGSVVSEILRYKQTDRQVSCYFIIRIALFQETTGLEWSKEEGFLNIQEYLNYGLWRTEVLKFSRILIVT